MTADRLGFAVSLARKAGALAQQLRAEGGGLDYTAKGPQDYATNADYQVETLIRERIAQAYPDDGVLGEEEGLKGRVNGCWIVDPIDGTINFSRGMPEWSISIGYFDGQQFTHGVIYAPDLDLMAAGRLGHGAQINGRPVTLGQVHPDQSPVVALGLAKRAPFELYTNRLTRFQEAGYDYRRPGAATIGLLGVLNGWFDAYYEYSLNIWDCAAGLALVQAAGGQVQHGDIETFLTGPTPVLAHHGGLPNLPDVVLP